MLNKKVAIEVEIKNIKRVSKLKKELQELRAEMKATEKLTAEGANLGKKRAKQYSETATKVKHKSAEVRKLNKDLKDSNDTTKKVTKSNNSMAKQFVKGAAAIGIIVTAFRTVSRVVSSVVGTFSEFEFVMAKVNAISGATEAEFAALTASAEELGRTTFFTAEQVGQLQLNFSKLGFSAEEIMQAQKATLDLATATGSDLARSATVAASAVRGFGLDASETQRVVDVMAVAFSTSALDIEKFQTSMTKVAPIAKAAGFSIEDTTTIMAKLSDAGIEASIAGTSLRNILLKMQDPSSDLSKSFGTTIHSLDELIPAMRNFSREGGSMADVMEVVDLRQAAAFELMLANVDILKDYRNSLKESGGEAARMAKIVGDTLQGAFLKFKSATQGLSISIMKDFNEGLQSATETLAKWGNFLSENSKVISGLIKVVMFLTKVVVSGYVAQKVATATVFLYNTALFAYTTVTKGATVATALFTKGVTKMKTALARTGIGLVVVGLGYLIEKFLLASDATDDLTDSTEKLSKQKSKILALLNKEIADVKLLSDLNIKEYQDELDRARVRLKNLKENGELDWYTKQNKIKSEKTLIANLQDRIRLENKYQNDRATQEANEIAQKTDLLYIQNELLKAAREKPAATEEALLAKQREIEAIQIEIDRLNSLNETKTVAYDLDKEMLAFKVEQLMQGLLSEKEAAAVKKQLIQEEIQGLKKQLSVFIISAEQRKKILKEIAKLESDITKNTEEDKEEAFKADVKRAMLSGQTAEEAMKSVVRAQIMEGVAGFMASIFKSVPFPLNLVLAAGAGAVVGRLIDQQIAKFGDGGVIEKYADGGMVHGKSHAQGGEKFAVGGRVAELEGGEAVINKRSTAMFKGQLSAMNAAGGGVKFADGGLMNMPSFASSQFDAMGQQNMMGAMNQSSKVVVVEADITTSQNTVGVIEAEATF